MPKALLLSFFFFVCSAFADDKPQRFIYLAGPEVFLPDPIAAGKAKQATIAKLNANHDWPIELVGLYPLDNVIDDFGHNRATGLRIYEANIALMQQADAVAANMVRFRGPSMDVGTAFEMGYMAGLGKPVFAYYDAKPFYGEVEDIALYQQKVGAVGLLSATNEFIDVDGQSVENFNMSDNLMMIGALQTGIGEIEPDFEALVVKIAQYLIAME